MDKPQKHNIEDGKILIGFEKNMLDINYIRENTDKVREAIKDRHSKFDLDRLLEIDEQRKALNTEVEALRAKRNEAAKTRQSRPTDKDIEKGKGLKTELDKKEAELKKINDDFIAFMLMVPNIPLDEVPLGIDDSENVVIRKFGEPKKFNFRPKDHLELGEALGIIDVETAAKVSGSRFVYLKGEAVLLQMALINYAFKVLGDEELLKTIAEKVDKNLSPKAFIPVIPPVMIKPEVYIKMARLDPMQAEERYHLQNDNIYLIGSAEHTLGSMHMDEAIPEDRLPLRYVGYSSAFRREAGSYGKDTKGILRVHQFDKVEIETFSTPESSLKEQEFIVAIQEHLMQGLNLPYQVVSVCTGDLGTPDQRQFDIETFMPAQNVYRETHSADNTSDYQARRLGTKVKRKDGSSAILHMNDATVFAIGRTLIAILENNQQEDGSVLVPEVLIPYTGFSVIKVK